MRIVLGEGTPAPVQVFIHPRTRQVCVGVRIYDREGMSCSLDQAAILKVQHSWVCVVLEVVDLADPLALPVTLPPAPLPRLQPYIPLDEKETIEC